MITKAYRLLRIAGQDMLLCLWCDKFTFDPQEVGEGYCGYCHEYLRDIPRTARRHDDERVPQHDPLPTVAPYVRHPVQAALRREEN